MTISWKTKINRVIHNKITEKNYRTEICDRVYTLFPCSCFKEACCLKTWIGVSDFARMSKVVDLISSTEGERVGELSHSGK